MSRPFFLLLGFAQCLFSVQSVTSINANSDSRTYLDTLPPPQRSLFNDALDALDANFAPPFLFNTPRYTAWYSVGLLARNRGDDVKKASTLIRRVIDFQFKDPSKLWFGTFREEPNAPDPGPVYPPIIYGTYDPNMALFVCTSWIIALEEFRHLLDPDLTSLMEDSMYNATIGAGYRVGGVNLDNLYPVYSNPWYMRVMAATYVGNLKSDKNMTTFGDIWAQQAIAEFERFNTLSEFNSGTYTGVTLYALSLWGYMPKHSLIAQKAPGMIAEIWMSVGQFYNPSLGTLGGPWDRAYGYDMKNYYGILGAQLTGLIRGSKGAPEPIPSPLIGSEHFEDVAAMVLIPLISKFHDHLVPSSIKSRLTRSKIKGSLFKGQAVSPPFEDPAFPRNYTCWNDGGISVGGMEIDGRFVGGAATSPEQNKPAVILWKMPNGQTNWIVYYTSASSISARATAHNLTIAYPPSRAFPNTWRPSNVMSLLVFGFPGLTLDTEFGSEGSIELPGIRLNFSGNIVQRGQRSLIYGAEPLLNLLFYNLTYTIPPDLLTNTPELLISFERL